MSIKLWLGERLSAYLSQTTHVHGSAAPTDPARLIACLKPGDVLLVEGQTRLSVAIKYLTQSTWSHAALYAGDITGLYLKNVVDSARYLFPTPPVPVRWRRRMLALGSGDPTRAICSTLTAQAFQSVRYPILPTIASLPSANPQCPGCVDEILHVRHHSLFVPRDFDVSPYFAIVKPTLAAGFDHRTLKWHVAMERQAAAEGAPVTRLREVI